MQWFVLAMIWTDNDLYWQGQPVKQGRHSDLPRWIQTAHRGAGQIQSCEKYLSKTIIWNRGMIFACLWWNLWVLCIFPEFPAPTHRLTKASYRSAWSQGARGMLELLTIDMTIFQWYLTDVTQQTSYHNTTQHTSYQENSPKIRITCTHWSFSYRLVLGHWTGHPSPGGKYDRYIYILTAGNTGKMFNNDKNDQWPFHSSGLYFTWHSPRRALQAQSLYRSSKHLCHHVQVVHDVIVGDNGFVGDYDIVWWANKMSYHDHCWTLVIDQQNFFKLYRYFVERLDMDAETDLCR